jgi:hypothetical protein
MQLSLLFPFRPAWVVDRGHGVFIVAFEGVAPVGFADWVRSSGVLIVGVAPLSPWRSYGAGVAVCVRVPGSVAAVLSSFRSGAGGSTHPSNLLPW